MTSSVTVLGVLITVATVLVAVAPVVLLAIWLKDHKEGRLW
jgi:hypothetical protein